MEDVKIEGQENYTTIKNISIHEKGFPWCFSGIQLTQNHQKVWIGSNQIDNKKDILIKTI